MKKMTLANSKGQAQALGQLNLFKPPLTSKLFPQKNIQQPKFR
jgi:hypothetical protein